MAKLKAYLVNRIDEESYCELVFAENASKAKSEVFGQEPFECVEYTWLSATREPKMDKYVDIRTKANKLDYRKSKHRKILEDELGWHKIED